MTEKLTESEIAEIEANIPDGGYFRVRPEGAPEDEAVMFSHYAMAKKCACRLADQWETGWPILIEHCDESGEWSVLVAAESFHQVGGREVYGEG